ncbi:hypothetical protein [Cellulomonas aerilata]|uniref:DUF4386 domain-containing protein n=1 Tax=Cellulomonas aerilata TaxID=515326 RepID=A0A512DE84_9CELL|nr:hypothetical protein [Cellulomonas aerilata]GEO34768.1 hypothetical protein CAE01nite_24930 [Cellulomonas aerilata]
MTLTSRRLTAVAGLCAAAAGVIFIGVQVDHPPADVAHLVSTEMLVRETAKALMAALALVGLTGLLLRHRDRLGVVGLTGFVVLTVGYLALFAVQCIVAYVLPTVARSDPGYVQDVLDVAVGGSPSGDIGAMQELLLVSGVGYALGGLLFGVALFRAGVAARWASLLLAYGTTSALALSVLPESFNRPFAVPTGVALVGLGLGLWRDQRAAAVAGDAVPAVVRDVVAGAVPTGASAAARVDAPLAGR